jgi:hypothetical protein
LYLARAGSAIDALQAQLKEADEIIQKGRLSRDFTAWQTQTLNLMERAFSEKDPNVQNFRDIKYFDAMDLSRAPSLLKERTFVSGMETAKRLISTSLEILRSQKTNSQNRLENSVDSVSELYQKFPRVAHQICSKYRNREMIRIGDEYDVQHIIHAMLLTRFDDVRPEDVNPSYAGATSRVDFLLKKEKIVVEVKKTRQNLRDKEVGEQLIVDMKRYSQNQDCYALICFVYDQDHLISNPSGLENDLNGYHDNLLVRVVISPKR